MMPGKLCGGGPTGQAFVANPTGSGSYSITTFQYPGASSTLAMEINNLGQIVGTFFENNTFGNFIRFPSGEVSAIQVGRTASDINDAGQIVLTDDLATPAGDGTYILRTLGAFLA